MIKVIFLAFFVFASESLLGIQICVDENFWYPYTFRKDGEADGFHVDIVKSACLKNKITCEFISRPWKRCLSNTEKTHGILSASYNAERAESFFYPKDAGTIQGKEGFEVSLVTYNVVTHKDLKMDSYDGNLHSVPSPVRSFLGYSVNTLFKEQNIKIFEFNDSMDCLTALEKSKMGSMIATDEFAKYFLNKPPYDKKLKVLKNPIITKPYYLAFSKVTMVDEDTRQKMWETIKNIRNSDEYNELIKKYLDK